MNQKAKCKTSTSEEESSFTFTVISIETPALTKNNTYGTFPKDGDLKGCT